MAFVRMIFTADGGFNPGGCKALKIMMQGPLQLFVTEETRLQIIRVADRLLADEAFALLFKGPLEIHKDIKELISIDLQLPKNEPINCVYWRWDLLIALISPISQLDTDGNCFTIATAANILVNSPETVIKMLTEILDTGNLKFDNKNFSIHTLLEGARAHETDFLHTVSHKDISELTPFLMLRECLNVSQVTQIGLEMMSLNSSMELQFNVDSDYAKQVYLSLKQNLLQKLLIAMIQFAAINVLTKPKIETVCKDISSKETFTNKVLEYIDLFFYEEKNIDDGSNRDLHRYLEKLKKVFSESFYFVDYKNWNMKIDNGFASFDFHEKGLLLEDNEDFDNQEDYDCFMQQRRLFFYESDKLSPVDSISKFKECLWKIVSQLENQTRTRNYDFENEQICVFMESEEFEEKISKILVGLNSKDILLEADTYQSSDSLIIAQNGSTTTFLELWKPLRSCLSPVTFSAKTISSFFFQVCKLFASYSKGDNAFNANSNSWILVEDRVHLYNFYPFRFKEYWDGKTITKAQKGILKSITVDRVEKNSTFTIEKKERILTEVFGKTTVKLLYHLIHNSLNSQDFAKEAKKKLPQELHLKLDQTINRLMNEIAFNDVKANLIAILSYAGDIASTETIYDQILAKIENMAEVYPYFTPYQLAKVIHKMVIKTGSPITITVEGLENNIRELASMPAVIDIGNLNWTIGLEENPNYFYLSIKYDFVYGLIFCQRKNGNEYPLDAQNTHDILKHTVMYLPK